MGSRYPPLFVSQSLNRIQPRGAQSRNHPANQSHGAENQRGRDQRSRSDDQAYIAGFPILGKGAVQGQPAHGKRDRVGQYHSQHTADKGNGEGLSEELGEDVPALRAQRLLHANLTRPLRDRNQHDIHQADAADAERKRADETHQHLQPESDDFELMELRHQVEYFHGLVVGLVELVLRRHDGADRLSQFLVLRSQVGEPDRVQVMGILQIAHGAEGDVYDAVDIVISLLHFGAQDADDFEAQAVNPDALTQRVSSGKQFFLRLRTDHRYAGALDLVFHVVEPALLQPEGADRHDVGIVAGDTPCENPGVVLDACLLAGFGSDVGDLGKVGGKRLYIILSKADEVSRLLTTGLHGSTARHHDDKLSAEICKDVGAGPSKSIAISEQHDHRSDPPGHAQHGQRRAAAIVTHGGIGFVEQIAHHRMCDL